MQGENMAPRAFVLHLGFRNLPESPLCVWHTCILPSEQAEFFTVFKDILKNGQVISINWYILKIIAFDKVESRTSVSLREGGPAVRISGSHCAAPS